MASRLEAERGPPARNKDADRRRAILRAAVEVFAEKGYHGCRIADVAQKAEVAYGLVYHYFGSKEALLQSVFDLGWTGFLARIEEVVRSEAPLGEKVRRICRVAFEAHRVDPKGVRVLILEIARSPAGDQVNRRGAFSRVLDLCEAMFREAKAKGELRDGLDPRLCAALLFGALEIGLTAIVMGLLGRSDESAEDALETQIAQIFCDGALVPRSTSAMEAVQEASCHS